jgi:hypothetical protein
VRDHVNDLREVDHHERARVDEQVVGRQVAVGQPAAGERDEGVHQLIPEIGQLPVVRARLG